MKNYSLLSVFIFLFFSVSLVSAEKWETSGEFGPPNYKKVVLVDTDSILPVITEAGIQKNVYRILTKIDGEDTQFKAIINLNTGKNYTMNDDKVVEKWSLPTEGHNGIFDLAFIYKNKSSIDSRSPYQLEGDEAKMPITSGFVEKNGWRHSYTNDQTTGSVLLTSIQTSVPNESKLSSIRFWTQMTSAKNKKMSVRLLIEVNPNSPQTIIVHALKVNQNGKWIDRPVKKEVESLDFWDFRANFATTAYEYAVVNQEELSERGYFSPNENIPADLLKLPFK